MVTEKRRRGKPSTPLSPTGWINEFDPRALSAVMEHIEQKPRAKCRAFPGASPQLAYLQAVFFATDVQENSTYVI